MSEPTIFSDTFLAMGAHCDVVLPNVSAGFAKKVFQQVKSEVEQLENSVSRHSLVSSIWEINNSPKNEWLEVPGEIWEVLIICKGLFEMSQGAFDVTVAPLQALWNEKENPTHDELENTRKKCGFNKIEFDTENKSIRFTEEDMELDFGVIERAYALDLLKPMLLDLGVEQAVISFEEDTVLALGNHPGGEYWPIGIRNQQKPNDFVQVFPVNGQSVTTLGTTYIRDDGEGMKPRTIISPETGRPVEGKKTVSVKSSSAIMGAFVSSIWLILPENDKSIIAGQLSNIEILECEYQENDVVTKLTILEEEGA